MSGVDLSDFLGHLGEAIKVARDGCADANIKTLEEYLEETDKEAVYKFRTISIKIGPEIISVPLFGLTPQGHLDLDRIEVEFDTIIGISPKSFENIDSKNGNPKFSITLSRGVLSRSSEMKVKACFSLKEACESAEQIRDKINKLIPLNGYREELEDG